MDIEIDSEDMKAYWNSRFGEGGDYDEKVAKAEKAYEDLPEARPDGKKSFATIVHKKNWTLARRGKHEESTILFWELRGNASYEGKSELAKGGWSFKKTPKKYKDRKSGAWKDGNDACWYYPFSAVLDVPIEMNSFRMNCGKETYILMRVFDIEMPAHRVGKSGNWVVFE